MSGMLKKMLLLAVTMLFVNLCAMAATPGVTFYVQQYDESGWPQGLQTVSFTFASRPKVEVTTDKIVIKADDIASEGMQFEVENVDHFEFKDDVQGVEDVQYTPQSHPVFGYHDGVVAVSNLKVGERVAVVAINGITVFTAFADNDGCANVDISGIASGLYVVNVGTMGFKIVKK